MKMFVENLKNILFLNDLLIVDFFEFCQKLVA